MPPRVATDAVRSYRTLSPLPLHVCRGGLLSVALAVSSHCPDVIWHATLWSPDFPPLCTAKRRLSDQLKCIVMISRGAAKHLLSFEDKIFSDMRMLLFYGAEFTTWG